MAVCNLVLSQGLLNARHRIILRLNFCDLKPVLHICIDLKCMLAILSKEGAACRYISESFHAKRVKLCIIRHGVFCILQIKAPVFQFFLHTDSDLALDSEGPHHKIHA